MRETPERWLVAAWPGLGHVATTAAVYLLSKLSMHQVAEFKARGFFELESVDVDRGLVRAARLPRSRLFLWRNPKGGRDIVVFLGEAQPPSGKLALCERLIAAARALGVKKVFTFSAMATEMTPASPSRIFGVASDASTLAELRRHDVAIMGQGRIAGLNGVALAAAAEAGLPAVGLLGEMPGVAPDLPCPNASAAVLKIFAKLAGLTLDLDELEDYGQAMQEQLNRLYEQVRQALSEGETPEAGETQAPAPQPEVSEPQPPAEAVLSDEDGKRVEKLFSLAQQDRSKAFELKRELDRLGLFARYEDRFLDLFEPRP